MMAHVGGGNCWEIASEQVIDMAKERVWYMNSLHDKG